MSYKVRDIGLAPLGDQKLEWAKKNMPILRKIEEEFVRTKPFEGIRVAISVHLEAKTACLAKLIAAGGGEVSITGSNPLSTQDDVAASLAKSGIDVYAWYNASEEEIKRHLLRTLGYKTNIIIDDGGDLINILHNKKLTLLPHIMEGCEETTTGVMRLKAMEKDKMLKLPMIAVNNAFCKYLFDNRYGTGQSVWDGINRTTNLIVAGKIVVVGYGWCGKGIAMRAKGFGASVIVCEIDPIKAMEAIMDGYKVMPMDEAVSIGDLFITVTGCTKVIHGIHFEAMKDGAILCNAGHFDVEICIPSLKSFRLRKKNKRKNIMGYKMKDGKWINILAEGKLVNLASGDGHPVEIMDMSFAIQALSAEYIVKNYKNLENKVIDVPFDIDQRVAQMKLEAWGLKIDALTEEQKSYMASWNV